MPQNMLWPRFKVFWQNVGHKTNLYTLESSWTWYKMNLISECSYSWNTNHKARAISFKKMIYEQYMWKNALLHFNTLLLVLKLCAWNFIIYLLDKRGNPPPRASTQTSRAGWGLASLAHGDGECVCVCVGGHLMGAHSYLVHGPHLMPILEINKLRRPAHSWAVA